MMPVVKQQRDAAAARRRRAVAALCWFLTAAAGLDTGTNATELPACDRDDLPLEQLKVCAGEIYKPGLSASDRARIYTLRGVAWMREEEPAAAVSDFTRAIDADPGNIAALKGRARANLSIKKYDDAAADWTRIIALRPDSEESYRERAEALRNTGKKEAALADFEKAIAIDPAKPESYIGRAVLFGELKRRDEAIREFDRAISVAPGNPHTYMARGAAAESWGETKLAIDSYRMVLKYPNDVSWYAIRALQRLGADWSRHRQGND